MDSTDLERYVVAKRQQRFATYITITAFLMCIAAGVLLYVGIAPSVSKAVLIGSALGLLLANSELGLYGTVVSRQTLRTMKCTAVGERCRRPVWRRLPAC